ncbi:MAG TPA: N-acetylornithine carbamoyltransferase [Pyrinomonadaceae bacterium]|jgi:N-acetylornithine carbamoyltransferase
MEINITKEDVQRICDEIEREPPHVLFSPEASEEEIANEVGRALLHKLFTQHFGVQSPDTEPEPDEYETPSQAKFNKFVAFVASYSQGIWHSSEYVARLMDALSERRRARGVETRTASSVEAQPVPATGRTPGDFLNTGDWTRDALERLLEAATRFKRGEDLSRPLAGKSVALVFFNPSLRTRASMQVGIYELGGNPVVLEPGGTSWTLEHRDGTVMDADKTEHVAEFVRVLGRYCSAIGVRTFAALKDWKEERQDPVLAAFARHSEVPVINLESAMHHPCQAMADMLTIREKLGGERKKRVLLTWAWHPKPLPMAVPNSFALAAAQLGHELTIAHPPGYELDDELIAQLNEHAFDAGTTVNVTNEVDEAFDGAEVIYAKSWGSKMFYGAPEDDIETRAEYRGQWIVDEAKMRRTAGGIFMHCLPVRRNVIVTDGVIDSPASVVIDEAENRLHVQKAVMAELIKGEKGKG